ncbi:MAG: ATP-binding protein [Candidatus Aminicenantes bacterium]|nr:ATP-binding protein [Candidatus Aminicenantes bacterium]
MNKFFNTAGLCSTDKHYMVDPLKRLAMIENLINKEFYFVIHAPRQSGKTTYLHALTRKLNGDGKYIALVTSFERAGFSSITMDKANETLIDSLYQASFAQLPEIYRPENPKGKEYLDLKVYLHNWARNQTKPIVLLIDEIDSLMDDVLVAMLRQLRDGYQSRPKHFPSSVALVGLRDIRDYKARIKEGRESMGTASPFNIISDSLTLKNFKKEEVFDLLDQHTQATGQEFPGEVKDEIFRLSGGQPWLTNALARQIVEYILEDDFTRKITPEIVTEAKKELILRRDTHLDCLIDKLNEERVKTVVQAIINGDNIIFDKLDDTVSYVRDLGIVSQTSPLKFANPIYAEIIPRIMALSFQDSLPEEIEQSKFVDQTGALDMEKLLKSFQVFYQRNSQAWLNRYEYKESAHHLLLMAFLQRIVNGGEIVREMAVGNGRLDMLVKFKKQEFALEIKIKRDNISIEEGKEQLSNYLDRLGLVEGYLVIFDPGKKKWEQKIYYKDEIHNNKKIIMVGM